MTVAYSSQELVKTISERFPSSITDSNKDFIVIKSEFTPGIIRFLKETPGFDFDMLNSITGVDYFDYFEIVYHLTSLNNNRSIVLKTRAYGRENPVVPSITGIYRGADFQEREIFDLFGVKFEGHPKMRRILLWEGFQGYPLRKDYLQ
jgi:NADH-quinone oxidoreductase subunit C